MTDPHHRRNHHRAIAASFLPEYRIRVSARAKRLQLKISPYGEVEVVVPRRIQAVHVQDFVRAHADWIQRVVAQIRQRPAQYIDRTFIPEQIELALPAENWRLYHRRHEMIRKSRLISDDEKKVLHIEVNSIDDIRPLLHRWLNQHAKKYLVPLLTETSEELGLPFNRVTVRVQRARWGSCSSKKNINLNRNLIFLPRTLVRYLCIHELCHTRHLNHSKAFWRLVSHCEPDYQAFERDLNRADTLIPAWAAP